MSRDEQILKDCMALCNELVKDRDPPLSDAQVSEAISLMTRAIRSTMPRGRKISRPKVRRGLGSY
jgi:hypothetical protein